MRTISFYSFKGGVGRSNLVLNLGYEFARRGKFVVIADWDLHAPGLTTVKELEMPDGPAPRKGVLDFLASALPPLPGDKEAAVDLDLIDPFLLAQPTRLAEEARARDPQFAGDLFFIPAGLFAPDDLRYSEALNRIRLHDLESWKAQIPGEEKERSILEFFRDRVKEARSDRLGKDRQPDLLLLDSRTGFTEIGDLLLGRLVDHYVVLFGLNAQNLVGMELILRSVQGRARYGDLPSLLTLVASLVPVGEEDLLRERFVTLDKRLHEIARQSPDSAAREPLPRILRIPYHPRLALAEEVMLARYPESGPALSYQAIADHLNQLEMTHEQVSALVRGQVMAEVPPRLESDRAAPLAAVPPRSTPDRADSPPAPPDPYDALPPWNWVQPSLEVSRVLPGEPVELRRQFLDALAWSTSLSKEDRQRTLNIPASRMPTVMATLSTAREQSRARWNTEWKDLQWALAEHLVEWVELLAGVGALDAKGVWEELTNDGFRRLPAKLAGSDRFRLTLAGRLASRKHDGPATSLFLEVLGKWTKERLFFAEANRLRDRLEGGPSDTRHASPSEVSALLAAMDAEPRNAAALAGAAYWAMEAGWDQSAEAAAREAIAFDAASAHDWSVLCVVFIRLGQVDEAEHAMERALQLDPKNPGLWTQQGIFYGEKLQRYPEAAQALQNAIDRDPANPDAYLNDAEIAIDSGDLDRAARRLKGAEALLAPASSRRRIFASLHLALALRLGDHPVVETAAQLLVSEASSSPADTIWQFEALLSALSDLQANALSLLTNATQLASGRIDVATFQKSLEEWRAAGVTCAAE